MNKLLVTLLVGLLVLYLLVYFSPWVCSILIQEPAKHKNKKKPSKTWQNMLFSLGMVGLSLPPGRNLEHTTWVGPDKVGKNPACTYQGKSGTSMLCKCLYLNGLYEPTMEYYMKQTLKKGDTVIDVGANEGFFTILAAKLVGPQGRVYAIEPSKNNLVLLENNIKANQLKNIKILPIAAGNTDNKSLAYVECKLNGMWNGFSNNMTSHLKLCSKIPFASKTTHVPVKQLSHAIPKHENQDTVALIKIDTEGSEKQVVEGLYRFLTPDSQIDWIIEMVPKEQVELIYWFVVQCGYDAYMWNVDSISYSSDQIKIVPLNERETTMKNVLFTKEQFQQ